MTGVQTCALPILTQALLVPVTMTVRMQVLRRAWMTGVVCGFSRFCMTSSPRRLSFHSTVSLEGGQTRVGGHAVATTPPPATGQGHRPWALPPSAHTRPEAQSPGPTSSVAELLPCWVRWAAACWRGPPRGSQQLCSSAASGRSRWALPGRGRCHWDREVGAATGAGRPPHSVPMPFTCLGVAEACHQLRGALDAGLGPSRPRPRHHHAHALQSR